MKILYTGKWRNSAQTKKPRVIFLAFQHSMLYYERFSVICNDTRLISMTSDLFCVFSFEQSRSSLRQLAFRRKYAKFIRTRVSWASARSWGYRSHRPRDSSSLQCFSIFIRIWLWYQLTYVPYLQRANLVVKHLLLLCL